MRFRTLPEVEITLLWLFVPRQIDTFVVTCCHMDSGREEKLKDPRKMGVNILSREGPTWRGVVFLEGTRPRLAVGRALILHNEFLA